MNDTPVWQQYNMPQGQIQLPDESYGMSQGQGRPLMAQKNNSQQDLSQLGSMTSKAGMTGLGGDMSAAGSGGVLGLLGHLFI